jgi:hypothetical protein
MSISTYRSPVRRRPSFQLDLELANMTLTTPVIFATLAAILLVLKVLAIGRRNKDYPPGPPTIPILGNIHQVQHPLGFFYPWNILTTRQMPKRDAHLQFQKWANEYGPVYSLMLGTRVLVVLSGDQAVKDLLDKRSAIYSARPDMYIGQELCSGGLRFLMMVISSAHLTISC